MTHDNLMPPVPFQRGVALETSFLTKGNIVSFLASGVNTGGRFALVEFEAEPGNEPPPHFHEWEHELFYVLDGTVTMYAGDQVLKAGAGEVVFMPRGTAHAFFVTSHRLRGLGLMVADGEHDIGMDRFIMALGTPATSLKLPETATESKPLGYAHILEVSAANGVTYLSPDEVARVMPEFALAGADASGKSPADMALAD